MEEDSIKEDGMRVFNADKTIELTEYDLNLGHLEKDTLTKHIDAVEGVEEVGHYETVMEYPNGGKDVQWIVDVPEVEAVEEHDEVEEVLVYIPYTNEELHRTALEKELDEIDEWLRDHDYIGTKIATGRATVEDYSHEILLMSVKADRKNEIKAELGG